MRRINLDGRVIGFRETRIIYRFIDGYNINSNSMKRRRFFITSVLSGAGIALNGMNLSGGELKKDQERLQV